MEFFHDFLHIFLHVDDQLHQVIRDYGGWTYAILFLIIFCETGLVVTPFLPGDSLLFAAGAFAARGSLDVPALITLLSAAAIAGDAVNYAVGNYFGPRLLRPGSHIFKQAYLDRTRQFFERYGGKTIILARFVPIVRTFAPFLAGVGAMRYARFASYNIAGGIFWVAFFVLAGYYFGSIPFVERHFETVVIVLIALSVLPAVREWWRARRERGGAAA